MDEMRWYAVRCCCTPTKVLGFLRLPAHPSPSVSVLDHSGTQHTAQLKPIAHYQHGYASDEIAVYSEDRGIEFWRTISGFMEAKPPKQPFGLSAIFPIFAAASN